MYGEIATCKLCYIDLTYLRDYLGRVSIHPVAWITHSAPKSCRKPLQMPEIDLNTLHVVYYLSVIIGPIYFQYKLVRTRGKEVNTC